MKNFLILLLLFIPVCKSSELTLVHLNDIHSYFYESTTSGLACKHEDDGKDCLGGISRLVSKIKEIRATKPNVLVLASGDFYLADSYYPYHGWKFASILLPFLNLNATSLGNHDFDQGMFDTAAYILSLKIPVVVTNLIPRKGSFWETYVNKSIIVEIGGRKIGIVGYITPNTKKMANIGKSLSFVDEIPSLQIEVGKLKKSGVNRIIALGHSGHHMDKLIAESVIGIDVIISGNSDVHFDLPEELGIFEDVEVHPYPMVIKTQDQKTCLIVQVPQHGRYLGNITVTFDDDGVISNYTGKPIPIERSIKPDSETEKVYEKSRRLYLETNSWGHIPPYQTVIAELKSEFQGYHRECRMRECSLGNLVADAMFYGFQNHEHDGIRSRVDCAVVNSGSIRSSLPAGLLTFLDLTNALYLGDKVSLLNMTGAQLKKMLEDAIANYDPTGIAPPGSFLQVSKLKVEYDLAKPPGERVVSLKVQCSNCSGLIYDRVTNDEVYDVALPEYFLRGGDGFFSHYGNRLDPHDLTDATTIVKYLMETNPLPKIEQRISFRKSGDNNNLRLRRAPALTKIPPDEPKIPESSATEIRGDVRKIEGSHSNIDESTPSEATNHRAVTVEFTVPKSQGEINPSQDMDGNTQSSQSERRFSPQQENSPDDTLDQILTQIFEAGMFSDTMKSEQNLSKLGESSKLNMNIPLPIRQFLPEATNNTSHISKPRSASNIENTELKESELSPIAPFFMLSKIFADDIENIPLVSHATNNTKNKSSNNSSRSILSDNPSKLSQPEFSRSIIKSDTAELKLQLDKILKTSHIQDTHSMSDQSQFEPKLEEIRSLTDNHGLEENSAVEKAKLPSQNHSEFPNESQTENPSTKSKQLISGSESKTADQSTSTPIIEFLYEDNNTQPSSIIKETLLTSQYSPAPKTDGNKISLVSTKDSFPKSVSPRQNIVEFMSVIDGHYTFTTKQAILSSKNMLLQSVNESSSSKNVNESLSDHNVSTKTVLKRDISVSSPEKNEGQGPEILGEIPYNIESNLTALFSDLSAQKLEQQFSIGNPETTENIKFEGSASPKEIYSTTLDNVKPSMSNSVSTVFPFKEIKNTSDVRSRDTVIEVGSIPNNSASSSQNEKGSVHNHSSVLKRNTTKNITDSISAPRFEESGASDDLKIAVLSGGMKSIANILPKSKMNETVSSSDVHNSQSQMSRAARFFSTIQSTPKSITTNGRTSHATKSMNSSAAKPKLLSDESNGQSAPKQVRSNILLTDAQTKLHDIKEHRSDHNMTSSVPPLFDIQLKNKISTSTENYSTPKLPLKLSNAEIDLGRRNVSDRPTRPVNSTRKLNDTHPSAVSEATPNAATPENINLDGLKQDINTGIQKHDSKTSSHQSESVTMNADKLQNKQASVEKINSTKDESSQHSQLHADNKRQNKQASIAGISSTKDESSQSSQLHADSKPQNKQASVEGISSTKDEPSQPSQLHAVHRSHKKDLSSYENPNPNVFVDKDGNHKTERNPFTSTAAYSRIVGKSVRVLTGSSIGDVQSIPASKKPSGSPLAMKNHQIVERQNLPLEKSAPRVVRSSTPSSRGFWDMLRHAFGF